MNFVKIILNQIAEPAVQASTEATAKAAEQVATHQGMLHFVEQSDVVGKTLFVILCLMSLLTWYLIFVKGISNRIQSMRSKRFLNRFWNAKSLNEVAADLEKNGYNNPFGRLAHHAIKASNYHHQYGASRLSDVGTGAEFTIRNMRRVIDEETARMENGLTVMASIGATSPFIGLFGTVWGVYHALINIGMSEGVNINEVAGPVGEALIMTGLGLAVAIPAVLALNAFVRRNRVMLSKIDSFAHDVFAFVSTGATIQTTDCLIVPESAATTAQVQPKSAGPIVSAARFYPQSEKE
ncbi:Tol-Pal system protein TolQ [Oligella sp. MSHR50489EDL]|uniref:MotA/TolQ/ExbB proton channel family protein n=1 Tax=Oligella sp. MSHR50489EDL TaxID=3139409 RepID=UPI003D815ADC